MTRWDMDDETVRCERCLRASLSCDWQAPWRLALPRNSPWLCDDCAKALLMETQ